MDSKDAESSENTRTESLESTMCINIIDSVSYYLNFPTAKISPNTDSTENCF